MRKTLVGRVFRTGLLTAVVASVVVFGAAVQAKADPVPGQGAQVLQDFQGYATYSSSDGCAFVQTTINFGRWVMLPGGPQPLSATVSVGSRNFCTGQTFVSVTGDVPNAALTLVPNAKSAHATGDAVLTNSATGSSVSVAVNVTFVPTTVTRFSLDPHGGFVHIATAEGQLGGTITVDNVDFLHPAGTWNFNGRATVDSWLMAITH
ncbi:MAG TPA: hypothetical protein VNH40_07500 [Gaiellaceae bacterium]|nr:hypothetical protein [Gaiellaceae bacterium]